MRTKEMKMKRGLAAYFSTMLIAFPAWSDNEIYSVITEKNEASVIFSKGEGVVGEEVDLFTGGVIHKITDLSINGNGMLPIEIVRIYDTRRFSERRIPLAPEKAERMALGGDAWSFTVAPIVVGGTTDLTFMGVDACSAQGVSSSPCYINQFKVVLPDGSEEELVPRTGSTLQSRRGWRLSCRSAALRFPCADGRPAVLRDPSGKMWELTWKGINCWDSYSNFGTIHRYGYPDKLIVPGFDATISYVYGKTYHRGGGVFPLITEIKSSDGRIVSIVYEASPPEGAVTPRVQKVNVTGVGTVLNYEYDSVSGALKRVTSSGGRSYEYTYYGDEYYTSPPLTYPLIEQLAPNPSRMVYKNKYGLLKSIRSPHGGVLYFDYEPTEVWAKSIFSNGVDLASYDSGSSTFDPFDIYNGAHQYGVRVKSITDGSGAGRLYSYNPSRKNGVYDETTVTTLRGVEKHYFIGEGYLTQNGLWKNGVLVDPWKSSERHETFMAVKFLGQIGNVLKHEYIGGVWQLGLKVRVDLPEASGSVMYEWDKQTFSSIWPSQSSGRMSLRDNGVFVPVLKTVKTIINGVEYVKKYDNYDAYGNAGTELGYVSGSGKGRKVTREFDVDEQNNILRRMKTEKMEMVSFQ